eukprot:CAMPEP_0172391574 /NCGR_PEP_ID=MMETSP1061-20121228/7951_1 /TAXON_ID=37318 /ORGANISM="Pseudo-nitzschia pungens, Strain cf. pungens" /LENGTH=96 /DNA_ID=CAMNT_0013122231 /DNA_START=124 /DNA_END=412 /DNA_ORIENTATION=+
METEQLQLAPSDGAAATTMEMPEDLNRTTVDQIIDYNATAMKRQSLTKGKTSDRDTKPARNDRVKQQRNRSIVRGTTAKLQLAPLDGAAAATEKPK